MKLLGTPLCIMCDKAVEKLEANGITYEYFDITKNIENLKKFIHFRDIRKEFDLAKETEHVGIPCFMFEDGSLLFDLDGAIHRALVEEKELC